MILFIYSELNTYSGVTGSVRPTHKKRFCSNAKPLNQI